MKTVLAFLLHAPVHLLGCCGWFVFVLSIPAACSLSGAARDHHIRNDTGLELVVTPLVRGESSELEPMPSAWPVVEALPHLRPALRRGGIPLLPGEDLTLWWIRDWSEYASVVIETPDGRFVAREPDSVGGWIRDVEAWEPASSEEIAVAGAPSGGGRLVARALLVFMALAMLSQLNVIAHFRRERRWAVRD